MAFFETHCDKFSDEEENKLEYTPVHEEYILACEQVIENKMNENFSPEQIQEFYTAFPGMYEGLKDKNPDTVEIM